jgi:hypothetical protein
MYFDFFLIDFLFDDFLLVDLFKDFLALRDFLFLPSVTFLYLSTVLLSDE